MPKPIKLSSAKPKLKKAFNILDRIQAIGLQEPKFKVLVYGVSGTGKTTFASTFPGPILSVVCSGGNRTGENLSILTPENRKKISQIQIDSSEDLTSLVSALREENQFTTLILDHISGIQDVILKGVLGLEEIPAQKSWGLATQAQYGQCTLQCKEIVRGFLNLDCNVIILGQERTFNSGEDSGGEANSILAPTVGVAVSPSLAGWLNPACDFVLQAFKRPVMVEVETKVAGKIVKSTKRGKGVQYCLRTEPHDVYITKVRKPKTRPLPDVIVDPTYEKLKALLKD